MNLTDLLGGENYHDLTHEPESEAQRHARAKRVEECFGPHIMKCIRECGSVLASAQVEYRITLTTLAIVDKAIEAVTTRRRQ